MHLRDRLLELASALLEIERRGKKAAVFTLDIGLCLASILIAFSLRVGAFDFPLRPVLVFASVAVPAFIPIFLLSGAYAAIWRFVGGRAIFQLARASAYYALPLMAVFLAFPVPGVPRTVALLHPMIFFGLAATARITIRHLLAEVVMPRQFRGGIARVFIYGAGSAGQQLASAIRHEPSLLLLGYVDDDPRLSGQKLNGLPIFHGGDLAAAVARREVDTVLLALPRASRARRGAIIETLRPLGLHVRTLPNLSELAGGAIEVADLRDVRIEDLLGRDPVQPNEILLGREVVGKTVLVTGAGGSIGSELCRQLLAIGARRLVLVERSEFALYAIDQELADMASTHGHTSCQIAPVLASVTNFARMTEVFARFRPDTVFHVAAYKHVPLLEINPIEAIKNNILGTRAVAEAALRARVASFTLVSTDKAVRPTNVMGATKRAAEQVVQAYAARVSDAGKGPRFALVRFGNVLGSSGSVVPLFRRQIEAGGPITLTHRDVTRFFMTIPEAAQLVIQAGGMAKGGEVFVLEMGEPVRIHDLARAMIDLSGLTLRDRQNPEGDIAIREVGLRPGEKLHEELLIGHAPQPTVHDRIMKAEEGYLPEPQLMRLINRIVDFRDTEEALGLLGELVPEFDHQRDNRRNLQARL